MTTNRLEAFSDGVIAIAITLLVLDIGVPEPGSGSLGSELLHQWPSYAAFAISFITIEIVWVNHHVALARLAAVDHKVLMLNLLLLMTVSVLPFTTSLMSEYLREEDGASLAAAVYGTSFLVMGCAFFLLHRYCLRDGSGLVGGELGHEDRRRILRRNAAGIAPYALAAIVAPISPYATIAICALVAVYYALPAPSAPAKSSP